VYKIRSYLAVSLPPLFRATSNLIQSDPVAETLAVAFDLARSRHLIQSPKPAPSVSLSFTLALAMAAAAAIGLCEDDRGFPRSLPLLAALVEEDARLHAAAAASQPAGSDLVRAFRGRTVPKVPIRDFLERIYVLVRSEAATGQVIRVDGTCFVLAGVYLTRFIGSHAARVAGIVVEPSTAHRLVAVALFLGGHSPKNWAAVFEAASDRAIRTGEIAGLEERFLRAISSRLFVDGHEFKCFCGVLEKVPLPPLGSCASKKRRADAVTGDEEEHRRVRACVPPPAVMSN